MSVRRCGTCRFWAKPATTRALKDRCYPCIVAVEPLVLPACMIKAIGKFIEVPSRQPMERDEGTLCGFWEGK